MAAPDTTHDAPRQRILDAALELLAEHGYEGMSLQQVADRVALHKSSLFHHFKSKEELAREVYRGISERLLKRIEPLLAEDPPRVGALVAALDASVEHFAEEPAAARLLLRLMVTSDNGAPGGPFSSTPGEVDGIGLVLRSVGSWLARARRAGVIRWVPVRHTVMNLMGLSLFYPAVLHHIPRRLLDSDPGSPENLERRKSELRAFLRGALAVDEEAPADR
jgi:AcrR family transcriptional regulator